MKTTRLLLPSLLQTSSLASVDGQFAQSILEKYGFSRSAYLGRFALVFRDPETDDSAEESEGSQNIYQLLMNVRLQLEQLQHEESPFFVTKMQTLKKLEQVLVQQNQFLLGATRLQLDVRRNDRDQVIRERVVQPPMVQIVQPSVEAARSRELFDRYGAVPDAQLLQRIVRERVEQSMLVMRQETAVTAEVVAQQEASKQDVVVQVDREPERSVARRQESSIVQPKRSGSFVQLTDEFVQRLRQEGLVKSESETERPVHPPRQEGYQEGSRQLLHRAKSEDVQQALREEMSEAVQEVVQRSQQESVQQAVQEAEQQIKQGSLADVVQQALNRARRGSAAQLPPEVAVDVSQEELSRTVQEVLQRTKQEHLTSAVQQVIQRIQQQDLTTTLQLAVQRLSSQDLSITVQEIVERTKQEDLSSAVQKIVERTKREDLSSALQEIVERTKREELTSAIQEIVQRTNREDLSSEIQEIIERTNREELSSAVQEIVQRTNREDLSSAIQEIIERTKREELSGAVQEIVQRTNREDLSSAIQEIIERTKREELSSAVQEIVQRTNREDLSSAIHEIIERTQREDLTSAVHEIVQCTQQDDLYSAVHELVQRTRQEDLTRVLLEMVQRTQQDGISTVVQQVVQRTKQESLTNAVLEIVQRTKQEDLQTAIQHVVQRTSQEQLASVVQDIVERTDAEDLSDALREVIQRMNQDDFTNVMLEIVQRAKQENVTLTVQELLQRTTHEDMRSVVDAFNLFVQHDALTDLIKEIVHRTQEEIVTSAKHELVQRAIQESLSQTVHEIVTRIEQEEATDISLQETLQETIQSTQLDAFTRAVQEVLQQTNQTTLFESIEELVETTQSAALTNVVQETVQRTLQEQLISAVHEVVQHTLQNEWVTSNNVTLQQTSPLQDATSFVVETQPSNVFIQKSHANFSLEIMRDLREADVTKSSFLNSALVLDDPQQAFRRFLREERADRLDLTHHFARPLSEEDFVQLTQDVLRRVGHVEYLSTIAQDALTRITQERTVLSSEAILRLMTRTDLVDTPQILSRAIHGHRATSFAQEILHKVEQDVLQRTLRHESASVIRSERLLRETANIVRSERLLRETGNIVLSERLLRETGKIVLSERLLQETGNIVLSERLLQETGNIVLSDQMLHQTRNVILHDRLLRNREGIITNWRPLNLARSIVFEHVAKQRSLDAVQEVLHQSLLELVQQPATLVQQVQQTTQIQNARTPILFLQNVRQMGQLPSVLRQTLTRTLAEKTIIDRVGGLAGLLQIRVPSAYQVEVQPLAGTQAGSNEVHVLLHNTHSQLQIERNSFFDRLLHVQRFNQQQADDVRTDPIRETQIDRFRETLHEQAEQTFHTLFERSFTTATSRQNQATRLLTRFIRKVTESTLLAENTILERVSGLATMMQTRILPTIALANHVYHTMPTLMFGTQALQHTAGSNRQTTLLQEINQITNRFEQIAQQPGNAFAVPNLPATRVQHRFQRLMQAVEVLQSIGTALSGVPAPAAQQTVQGLITNTVRAITSQYFSTNVAPLTYQTWLTQQVDVAGATNLQQVNHIVQHAGRVLQNVRNGISGTRLASHMVQEELLSELLHRNSVRSEYPYLQPNEASTHTWTSGAPMVQAVTPSSAHLSDALTHSTTRTTPANITTLAAPLPTSQPSDAVQVQRRPARRSIMTWQESSAPLEFLRRPKKAEEPAREQATTTVKQITLPEQVEKATPKAVHLSPADMDRIVSKVYRELEEKLESEMKSRGF